jgi:hypothetical protein
MGIAQWLFSPNFFRFNETPVDRILNSWENHSGMMVEKIQKYVIIF